jgi:hypothetical protein
LKSGVTPSAPTASRASVQMFPIPGFVEKEGSQVEYGALKSGSIQSDGGSNESLSWRSPMQDNQKDQKDDLYSWMAKQQQQQNEQQKTAKTSQKDKFADARRSFMNSIRQHTSVQPVNSYMQDSVRLLDAHLIFEPLLTCLGVMPQQMINNSTNKDVTSFENLGTNLSLVCSFDTMRIDIVVSEAGDKKPKTKISKKANGKFSLQIENDTPAFLCERVEIELEVLKMADGFPDEPKMNLLYLSRGQLKKHTSTVINFSLNVNFISQQVNMPLLRLLHQITNMYQNVKEAQNELRVQPEMGKRNNNTMKDESSLASEINDATLMASLHEPVMHLQNPLFDYSDERYDKFNEAFPLGHSVSR